GILSDENSLPGFADWAEQLIAESTGKVEKGILPVALTAESKELVASFDDLVLISVSESDTFSSPAPALISGRLGEQFLLWEYATAVASRLIQVNPFDQPDVESAKVAARGMLTNKAERVSPAFSEEGLSVSAKGISLDEDETVTTAIRKLLDSVSSDGYVSVQGYLNRKAEFDVDRLRNLLVEKTNRPVTFGFGPRFLHSTGQYHKGGPRNGVFLQLIAETDSDLKVPTRDFSFAELISAQAEGDAKVLADLGRPVLKIGLASPIEDFARLIQLIERI
ncbi:MAG: hypothetical protein RLZZ556_818, partial [Actinomycetota bacterium]